MKPQTLLKTTCWIEMFGCGVEFPRLLGSSPASLPHPPTLPLGPLSWMKRLPQQPCFFLGVWREWLGPELSLGQGSGMVWLGVGGGGQGLRT